MILETEIDGLLYSLDTDEQEATVKKCIDKERTGEVVIPKSFFHEGIIYQVTRIGENAFAWRNITSITIPEGVTSIGEDAFCYCCDLAVIKIPEQVKNIGEDAFSGCISLNSLHIKDVAAWCNIEFSNVESNPLSNGSSLYLNGKLATELIIPEGVERIGNFTFYSCSSLIAVKLPLSITYIGDFAFQGCCRLTSINIPEGVTYIGNFAFDGCKSIKSIIMPKSVTRIGGCAFRGCIGKLIVNCDIQGGIYQDIAVGVGVLFSFCGNKSSKITIGENVKNIGDYAFMGCHNLTSINIPKDSQLTNIGKQAFDGCSKLTSINIPGGVTNIGDRAFSECSKLTAINIPEGVTYIGDSAFYGCSNLSTINIPESVTYIGNRAFYGCSNLSIKNIPESVKYIGQSAFEGCKILNPITISESVTEIGKYAFRHCNCEVTINCAIPQIKTSILEYGWYGTFHGAGFRKIILGKGVTCIERETFAWCGACSSIIIPDSVTRIEMKAFAWCGGLASIVIPKSVTHLDSTAFEGCSNLVSIIVEADNEKYDSREGCNAIIETESNTLIIGGTNTIIPKSISSIGSFAFSSCNKLNSILIPKNVSSIGYGAFENCWEMTFVTLLGNPVVEKNAFNLCKNLTNIYCYSEDTPPAEESFGELDLSCITLHVPENAIEAYRNTEPWCWFGTIVAIK